MTVISRHPPWLCSGQDRVFPILGALMGSWQPRTVLARICLHLLLGVCGISATDCQLACAPSSPRLALGRSPGRAVLHLGLVATTQAKCEPRNSLQPAGWGPWMPHPVLCERSTKAEGFVVTTPGNAARALKRAVRVCLPVTMAPGSQVRIRPLPRKAQRTRSVAAAPHLAAFSSASHLRVPSHLVSWALGCSCGLTQLLRLNAGTSGPLCKDSLTCLARTCLSRPTCSRSMSLSVPQSLFRRRKNGLHLPGYSWKPAAGRSVASTPPTRDTPSPSEDHTESSAHPLEVSYDFSDAATVKTRRTGMQTRIAGRPRPTVAPRLLEEANKQGMPGYAARSPNGPASSSAGSVLDGLAAPLPIKRKTAYYADDSFSESSPDSAGADATCYREAEASCQDAKWYEETSPCRPEGHTCTSAILYPTQDTDAPAGSAARSEDPVESSTSAS